MLLTIFTKTDCPLCVKAEEQLREVFPELTIEKVDISGKPNLLKLYQDKLPVFFFAGEEIGYWHPPLKKIRKKLAASHKIVYNICF